MSNRLVKRPIRPQPLKRLNDSALRDLNAKYLNAYRFQKREVVLDQISAVIEASGATNAQLARISGVSPTTIRNWLHGAVNRPQNATIEAVLRPLGYTRAIVPLSSFKE